MLVRKYRDADFERSIAEQEMFLAEAEQRQQPEQDEALDELNELCRKYARTYNEAAQANYEYVKAMISNPQDPELDELRLRYHQTQAEVEQAEAEYTQAHNEYFKSDEEAS